MFLPHSDADRERMLRAVGASEDALFRGLKPAQIELWPAAEESEIMAGLAALQQPIAEPKTGLGLGAFPIPAAVDSLASRGEFVTAYTPYQPECSQGTLSVIFEFQTRVCELTGLEISNAGLYDGSTACAEAAMMALAEAGRTELAIARSVAPRVREVLQTLLAGRGVKIREIAFDPGSGRIDTTGESFERTAGVIVQSPNVFGVIESDAHSVFADAHASSAIPIQIFHPLAVALGPKPGEIGAEIAVAEGQPLGIPLSGGGPYLGLMAATTRFLRRMPGRIVGRTVDADGRDAFVLTLQTREQHIRRERATSNICTNQALIALRATIFLALMGESGLRRRAEAAAAKTIALAGNKAVFSGEIFNEFTVRGHKGIPLEYPELGEVSVMGVSG